MKCEECIHCKSYYFDEYDADTWCELEKPYFTTFKEIKCKDFKKNSKE